jgi:glycosyltransferase involved in cell wall biosynthesis
MIPSTKAEATPKLHVVYVNYWYEPEMASLEDLLGTYVTMARWAEALRAAGAEVSVFQRFHQNTQIKRGGVEFVLHKDGQAPRLPKWQVPRSFHRKIQQRLTETWSRETQVAIHFNGLHFPLQLRTLSSALQKRPVIVVQHHAERPSRGLRRIVQRWGLRAADGFFFAAGDLASKWVADRLIRADQPVYQVMEGSTDFHRQDRLAARGRTGFSGDPILLWVGRLIPLKDPLTVLSGFETILHRRPGARLYMVYGTDDLLPEVRACIAQSRLLSRSVSLLGPRPHVELESLYNSADYFVLGSHYEGSGYALAEALACGVVPVVTSIASFRALTDEGRIGACWPPGDSEAFAAAFHRAAGAALQPQSERAVEFFNEHLSYTAIAHAAINAYRDLAMKRLELLP